MANEPTTPAEAVEKAGIDGIKSVSSDGTTVHARSVDELIKADQYTAARSHAKKKGRLPFKMFRLRPGGKR